MGVAKKSAQALMVEFSAMLCPLCGSSRSSLVQKEPASPDPTRSPAYTQGQISMVACCDCSFVYVERDFPESYVNGYYEERAGGGYGLSKENFFWWHEATKCELSE